MTRPDLRIVDYDRTADKFVFRAEPTLRERISRFFAENAPALVLGFVAGVIAVVLPAYVVAWVVM